MSEVEGISNVDRRKDGARAFGTAKSNIAGASPSHGSNLCTSGELKHDTGEGHPGTQSEISPPAVQRKPDEFNGIFCDVTV
jgi:hypothetical protein